MSACRVWILVCALGLAVGLSACGQESDPPSGENDGVYVNAGPITYQLQVSRALSQYTVEDRQYLAGLPASETALTPNQLWYGVFLWAKNQTSEPHKTADTFEDRRHRGEPVLPDPRGHRDQRVRVDVADPGSIGIEPAPSTTASLGPTQGGLVLFKLPISVYSNRPLKLYIYAPGTNETATISLDF